MPGSLQHIRGGELKSSETHLLIYDQRGERKAAEFHLIFGWILAQPPLLPGTVLAHAPGISDGKGRSRGWERKCRASGQAN